MHRLTMQLQAGTVEHKGHDFVPISYHMPTTCEVCPKPLWHMIKPPAALECKREFCSHLFLQLSSHSSSYFLFLNLNASLSSPLFYPRILAGVCLYT